MAKRSVMLVLPLLAGGACLVAGSSMRMRAQEDTGDNSVIRKVVEMVQLNVAVTDKKGNYVTGLSPADFVIVEDRIPQKIATFEEGTGAPQNLEGPAQTNTNPQLIPRGAAGLKSGSAEPVDQSNASQTSPTSIYILFDTSNYMYRGRGFVFAQDAIAEFIRSIEGLNRIAFYSYSRDLSRQTPLTADRNQVLHGVRATVNGDDSALYNALLLTLKDAGEQKGRKAVVVFSNGPDNSSMVPPEDVGELAQSLGIPIYMVSTHEAKLDAVTAAVFARISANTGGEAYFAKNWKDQEQAFTSIRDDLAHLYLVSYYPQPNPNRGWRAITVKLAGEKAKQFHIRTREGYRPLPEHLSMGAAVTPVGQ